MAASIQNASYRSQTDGDRKEKFFIWLASKVSASQLSELYDNHHRIDQFCIPRNLLAKPLFQIDDARTIQKLVSELKKSLSFRIQKNAGLLFAILDNYAQYLRKMDLEKKNNLDPLVQTLRRDGFETVDRREINGCLWVIAGKEKAAYFADWNRRSIFFSFEPNGSTATGNRPAWWTRAKASMLPQIQQNKEENVQEKEMLQPALPSVPVDQGNQQKEEATREPSGISTPENDFELSEQSEQSEICQEAFVQDAEESLLQSIASRGLEFIDNRWKDGCLWVICGREQSSFFHKWQQKGIRFYFSSGGRKATKYRPAWWTKDVMENESIHHAAEDERIFEQPQAEETVLLNNTQKESIEPPKPLESAQGLLELRPVSIGIEEKTGAHSNEVVTEKTLITEEVPPSEQEPVNTQSAFNVIAHDLCSSLQTEEIDVNKRSPEAVSPLEETTENPVQPKEKQHIIPKTISPELMDFLSDAKYDPLRNILEKQKIWTMEQFAGQDLWILLNAYHLYPMERRKEIYLDINARLKTEGWKETETEKDQENSLDSSLTEKAPEDESASQKQDSPEPEVPMSVPEQKESVSSSVREKDIRWAETIVFSAKRKGISIQELSRGLLRSVEETERIVQASPHLIPLPDRLIHEDALTGWEGAKLQLKSIWKDLLTKNKGKVSPVLLYLHVFSSMSTYLLENKINNKEAVYAIVQHYWPIAEKVPENIHLESEKAMPENSAPAHVETTVQEEQLSETEPSSEESAEKQVSPVQNQDTIPEKELDTAAEAEARQEENSLERKPVLKEKSQDTAQKEEFILTVAGKEYTGSTPALVFAQLCVTLSREYTDEFGKALDLPYNGVGRVVISSKMKPGYMWSNSLRAYIDREITENEAAAYSQWISRFCGAPWRPVILKTKQQMPEKSSSMQSAQTASPIIQEIPSPEKKILKEETPKRNADESQTIERAPAVKTHSVSSTWEIVDDTTAIQTCDSSFVKYNGTDIPRHMYRFFDMEKVRPMGVKRIIIIYQNQKYNATIIKDYDTENRDQIFWQPALGKKLKAYTDDRPVQAVFKKIGKDEYELSVTVTDSIPTPTKEEDQKNPQTVIPEISEDQYDQPSGKYYSWEIIDANTAVKTCDKTFFERNESGVPKGILSFFDAQALHPREIKRISLIYQSKTFVGKLEREAYGGRVRIYWDNDTLFARSLNEYEDIPSVKAVFHKRAGKDEYAVEIVTEQLGAVEFASQQPNSAVVKDDFTHARVYSNKPSICTDRQKTVETVLSASESTIKMPQGKKTVRPLSIIDNEQLFFKWMREKATPERITELNQCSSRLNAFCYVNKLCHSPLFAIMDTETLSILRQKLEQDKRFLTESRSSQMLSLLRYYTTYIFEQSTENNRFFPSADPARKDDITIAETQPMASSRIPNSPTQAAVSLQQTSLTSSETMEKWEKQMRDAFYDWLKKKEDSMSKAMGSFICMRTLNKLAQQNPTYRNSLYSIQTLEEFQVAQSILGRDQAFMKEVQKCRRDGYDVYIKFLAFFPFYLRSLSGLKPKPQEKPIIESLEKRQAISEPVTMAIPASPSEPADVPDADQYINILRRFFPKGFQKESGLDMKRFRTRWEETYGKPIELTDEAIRGMIARRCVDTGSRWYLAEMLLTENDRKQLLSYIDGMFASGKKALYYLAVYRALEKDLESQNLTADLLTKYLQATCKGRYYYYADYLAAAPNTRVNIAQEIAAVMKEYGRPLHTDTLAEQLPHIPLERLDQEVHFNSVFLCNGPHVYFHESMADIAQGELEQIASMIQDALDDQGFMLAHEMLTQVRKQMPELSERLSDFSDMGQRSIFTARLRKQFTFTGKVITPLGQAMNLVDMFSMFCKRHAPFTLDELSAFAEECNAPIYWDTVHANCARVSEDQFVPMDAVRVNKNLMDAAIDQFCKGDYVLLVEINTFDAFPYAGYPWNAYLLEQYAATMSPGFTLMHGAYTKTGTPGVIVRRNAKYTNYDEILSDALAESSLVLQTGPCLDWLAERGYIARKKLNNMAELIARAKLLRSQKG